MKRMLRHRGLVLLALTLSLTAQAGAGFAASNPCERMGTTMTATGAANGTGTGAAVQAPAAADTARGADTSSATDDCCAAMLPAPSGRGGTHLDPDCLARCAAGTACKPGASMLLLQSMRPGLPLAPASLGRLEPAEPGHLERRSSDIWHPPRLG